MSKLNVYIIKKNDGIGSLFERSDAFQCCMFSSTLSSLVILVHLVKNLILGSKFTAKFIRVLKVKEIVHNIQDIHHQTVSSGQV